jgi:integrase
MESELEVRPRRKPRRKNRCMFQDKKGRWSLDFYTPDGKRKRKLCGSHEAARTALRKIDGDKKTGTYTDENSAPAFEDYSQHYLDEVSAHKNSGDRETRLMRNLVAHFGRTRLSKIKRTAVRDYRNARLKTVKKATVNREIALLRHLFNVAMGDGIVGANPARGGPGLEAFKEQPRERFLEMPEVETLLATLRARIAKNKGSGKKHWQYLHAAVTVALHTGMRKGEILGLRWEQVGWEKRSILLTNTKNDRSRRVPIDTILLSELAEHRRRVGEDAKLVFPSYDREGNVVPLNDVKVGFGIALTDAGISNFRFHDLRHTFASHYVMSGGNLYTLSKILGHSDLKMTQRYAELSPAYIDRERERMDTIWTPGPIVSESEAEAIEPKYVQ